jgi:hypothetical protein
MTQEGRKKGIKNIFWPTCKRQSNISTWFLTIPRERIAGHLCQLEAKFISNITPIINGDVGRVATSATDGPHVVACFLLCVSACPTCVPSPINLSGPCHATHSSYRNVAPRAPGAVPPATCQCYLPRRPLQLAQRASNTVTIMRYLMLHSRCRAIPQDIKPKPNTRHQHWRSIKQLALGPLAACCYHLLYLARSLFQMGSTVLSRAL